MLGGTPTSSVKRVLKVPSDEQPTAKQTGFSFEDQGEHELKGIHDRWRLYRVAE